MEQSLTIHQKTGNMNFMATTLHNMGYLLLEQKNLVESIPYFKQAYDILNKIGSPNTQITEGYLNDIKKQIGEAQFQAIVSKMSWKEYDRI